MFGGGVAFSDGALPLASPRAAGALSRARRGTELQPPGAPLVPAVHAAASR